jgi:hypothetical protein
MNLPHWFLDKIADMHLFLYLAIGGGLAVALALVLHYAPTSGGKVPGIIVGILGGLLAGVGLGVLAMGAFGWHWVPQEISSGATLGPPPTAGQVSGGPPGGMMAAKGGGGRGGNRGPNHKAQLASLINKLDVLTHQSLKVSLSAEQKTKLRDLIQKLDESKELSDNEAEAKLKDLSQILNEDQRKTLEAAGYRWPGQGGDGRGGSPTPSPNPFTEGENKEHLKSLRAQLEDKS